MTGGETYDNKRKFEVLDAVTEENKYLQFKAALITISNFFITMGHMIDEFKRGYS